MNRIEKQKMKVLFETVTRQEREIANLKLMVRQQKPVIEELQQANRLLATLAGIFSAWYQLEVSRYIMK